jgi:hypothetical protein
MKFRYLRDPLFLACLALYFANRWLMKPLLAGGFFHTHFNDLICLPFWVPIMLFGMQKLGLRADDRPPRSYEILIPLVMWSAVFELYLPQTPYFRQLMIADPIDIIYYALGGLGAALFWEFHYRPGQEAAKSAPME